MTEPPSEPVRNQQAAWIARARFAGLVLLALAVGSVLPQLIDRDQGDPVSMPRGSVEAQEVVAWALHAEGVESYVAVLATGEKPSMLLAIPAEVTINLPGQSLGTLADATAAGDQGLLEIAIENLLGVPVDETVLAPLSSLTTIVDDLGGIEVRERRSNGSEVASYLIEVPGDAPPDQPFLRWQDVLEGLIRSEADRPGALPEPLRPLVSGATPSLLSLPVVDIGGGLLRPDQDALQALVEEHLVPTTGDAIRLVVLNGVGTPGIGEEVARVLVPEGFLLVSSGNANTFDLEVTQIIASSRGDLQAAERARELLGAGEISLGNQPTGLADVTVVVGQDFGGS